MISDWDELLESDGVSRDLSGCFWVAVMFAVRESVEQNRFDW